MQKISDFHMDILQTLSEYTVSETEYWDFSGVIRILRKGNILFEACRGCANIEFNVEISMSTRFSVASVAKQFTAFAVMLLYDRKLLRLDEPACHYLPSHLRLPADITVHHLLSHTSGLHNNYNFEDDFYVGEDRKPCIMILSNTESLDQYRLGNDLAAILHGRQPSPSRREREISLTSAQLQRYTGTYLPGKIQIEQKNGKLYLVRINQNIHIELYCVGKHRFKRYYEEQQGVHTLLSEDDQEPSVWGYTRVHTDTI